MTAPARSAHRRIWVLGSLNEDLVVSTERLPLPGETVMGQALVRLPGGKGANQAVAAARMQGNVEMVGTVGNDSAGRLLIETLSSEGVGISQVTTDPGSTGIAVVTAATDGSNAIVVVPGANARTAPAQLASVALTPGDILLLQMEIPMRTIAEALAIARDSDVLTVLNAAPAASIENIIESLDVLIVNEHELGIVYTESLPQAERRAETPVDMMRWISSSYDLTCITTFGADGAMATTVGGREPIVVTPPKVDVVDTTGAGDTFVGAFAAALASDLPLTSAVERAVVAGSLSCTAPGAQTGMPKAQAVNAVIESIQRMASASKSRFEGES